MNNSPDPFGLNNQNQSPLKSPYQQEINPYMQINETQTQKLQSGNDPSLIGTFPKFNVGAWLLAPFWLWNNVEAKWGAIALGLYLSCFIPILGNFASLALFAGAIWLGFKGNDLAWEYRHFNSLDEFKTIQKKWAWAGAITSATVIIISIASAVFFVTTVMRTVNSTDGLSSRALSAAYEKNPDLNLIRCKTNLKNIATACELYSADHNGNYPKSLKEIKSYLPELPTCPISGNTPKEGETNYEYSTNSSLDSYTLRCNCDHSAAGVKQGYIEFNSTDGLVCPIDEALKSSAGATAGANEELQKAMEEMEKAKNEMNYGLCSANMGLVASACTIYKMNHNSYPDNLDEAIAEFNHDNTLSDSAFKCPCGGSYVFEKNGDSFKIYCTGNHKNDTPYGYPQFDSTIGEDGETVNPPGYKSMWDK